MYHPRLPCCFIPSCLLYILLTLAVVLQQSQWAGNHAAAACLLVSRPARDQGDSKNGDGGSGAEGAGVCVCSALPHHCLAAALCATIFQVTYTLQSRVLQFLELL